MPISADGQAMLMLCSHVALPAKVDPPPLTLREWNPLARRLRESSLRSPAGLLALSADEIRQSLKLDADLAQRVAGLLQRGAALAIELERLESVGIWVVTRADDDYPEKLKSRLGESAPPVLFGAGEINDLNRAGLAVVGSRNIDEAGSECAKVVGEACAASKLTVFSGGARGTDSIAMHGAIDAGGRAVGVLADGLERTIREPTVRGWLVDGRATLLSPYSPKAGFSVGSAMGRNKLIYALADYALVVASDSGTGGTWAGAIEALRSHWIPVFVRDAEDAPEGNRQLLKRGGISFPGSIPCRVAEFADWLAEIAAAATPTNSLFA